MKAVDFIKKFGWGEARACILNCAFPEDKWFMRHGELISDQDFADLKQYVDAYELVRSYGGLKCCHEILHKLHELTENPEPIREAIALVEEVCCG